MESTSFARDRLVLVAAPDHRWARRKHVTLEDLAAEPLILRESGSGSRACFEQGLQRLHKTIRDFRVSLELGSNEAIKEAVLRGGGVAFLSVFAVRDDLESGRLVGVPVKGLEVGRDLYVVTDRRRVLPPAARAFLEILETRPFTRA